MQHVSRMVFNRIMTLENEIVLLFLEGDITISREQLVVKCIKYV